MEKIILSLTLHDGGRVVKTTAEAAGSITQLLMDMANKQIQLVLPLREVTDIDSALRILCVATSTMEHALAYWENDCKENDGYYHAECFLTLSNIELMKSGVQILFARHSLCKLALNGIYSDPNTFLLQMDDIYDHTGVKAARRKATGFLVRAWACTRLAKDPSRLVLIQRLRILNSLAHVQTMRNDSTLFTTYASMAFRMTTSISAKALTDVEDEDVVTKQFTQALRNKTLAYGQKSLLTGDLVSSGLVLGKVFSYADTPVAFLQLAHMQQIGVLTPTLCRSLMSKMKELSYVNSEMAIADPKRLVVLFDLVTDLLSPMYVHRCSIVDDIFAFTIGFDQKRMEAEKTALSMSRGLRSIFLRAVQKCICSSPKCKAVVDWKTLCVRCVRFYCNVDCMNTPRHHCACAQDSV